MDDFLPQFLQRMLPLLAAVALGTVAIRLLLMLAAPRLFSRHREPPADPVLHALGGSAISVATCPIWTRGEGVLLTEIRGLLATPPLSALRLTAYARVTLGEVMTVRGMDKHREATADALDLVWLSVLIAARDGMPRLAVAYRQDDEPRRESLGGGAYEDRVRRQACARAGLPLIEIEAEEPTARTLERVRAALARDDPARSAERRPLRAGPADARRSAGR